jgi:hypothetical protein
VSAGGALQAITKGVLASKKLNNASSATSQLNLIFVRNIAENTNIFLVKVSIAIAWSSKQAHFSRR